MVADGKKMVAMLANNAAVTEMIISGVRLTTNMFTAAVFVYSGLNFLMYRRIRKSIEEKESDDE